MNLFDVLNKGAGHAPDKRYPTKVQREIAKTRASWQNALLVDQTRAWLDLGEQQSEVLQGLGITLCIASFAVQHMDKGEKSSDAAAINAGLTLCDDCYRLAGAVLTVDDTIALIDAAAAAGRVFKACSDEAVVYASEGIKREVQTAKRKQLGYT